MTRDSLPLRVELQQLLCHVAHGFLDARLGLLPRGPAEFVERRTRAAGVLLDQIQPFYWDEQLVVAVVPQLEKFLRVRLRAAMRPTRRPQLPQGDELSDAVIDVNDKVAHLQVSKIGQERLREVAPLFGAAALLLEDIGFDEDLQLRVSQPEAA